MPQGLFYPWIDVRNEAWLRSSLLYWDSIRTIVPEPINEPYTTKTGRALQDEGFLVPLRVHSEMEEIQALTADAIEYLQSQEGVQLLVAGRSSPTQHLHIAKLSQRIRRLTEIHPDKLPYELRRMLWPMQTSQRQSEWLQVDEAFAAFYMTLLATRLGDRIGAPLLTSLPAADRLSLIARMDTRLPRSVSSQFELGRQRPEEYAAFGRRREAPPLLAQGLLATLAIERLGIAANTPLAKLLEFKRKHADELARFRGAIADLAKSVDGKLSVEALRERVATLHSDRVEPALGDLKGALRGLGIKWTGEGLLKVGFLSAAPTSALVFAGLAAPYALLAGASISLVATTMMYNKDKRDALRANPYSYLLSIKRHLV